jgi:hypothetical protein
MAAPFVVFEKWAPRNECNGSFVTAARVVFNPEAERGNVRSEKSLDLGSSGAQPLKTAKSGAAAPDSVEFDAGKGWASPAIQRGEHCLHRSFRVFAPAFSITISHGSSQ